MKCRGCEKDLLAHNAYTCRGCRRDFCNDCLEPITEVGQGDYCPQCAVIKRENDRTAFAAVWQK